MATVIAPEKPPRELYSSDKKAYYRAYAVWWRAKGKTPHCTKMKPVWDKAYLEKNRKRLLEYKNQYYLRNKNKFNILAKKYHKEHKPQMAEANRKWKRENIGKVRISQRMHQHKRNALKKAQMGVVSSGRIQELLVLQGSKCGVCNGKFGHSGFHIDHVIALSKGGLHDNKNLQLLCADCNLSKHNKDPIEFMQERGFLL